MIGQPSPFLNLGWVLVGQSTSLFLMMNSGWPIIALPKLRMEYDWPTIILHYYISAGFAKACFLVFGISSILFGYSNFNRRFVHHCSPNHSIPAPADGGLPLRPRAVPPRLRAAPATLRSHRRLPARRGRVWLLLLFVPQRTVHLQLHGRLH